MSIITKNPPTFRRFVTSAVSDINLPLSPINLSFKLVVCLDDTKRRGRFLTSKRELSRLF